jgi:tetratricopeptide (TPR) repeat protein
MIAFWTGALFSHVTAVFLLPATLWLLALEPDGRLNLKRAPLLRFAALGGLLTAGVLIAFYLQQVNLPGVATGHFFVTLQSEAPHYYGLFSAAHLLDLVNHWFLMAPAFIATVVALLLTPKAIFGKSTNSGFARLPQNSTLVLWTLVGAVPFLAGFVVDPKLGWPRDWDLYALLSAPACVGIAIWLDRQSNTMHRAAMAIAATSAALWLTFSVDGRAEQRRFEALLDLDVSRSDYGHEIMAQQYRREGDHDGMLRHYRAALAISENHRYRMNIAAAYFYLNKFDEAERWYRGVIARDSNNADAYHGLSLALSELRRPDEALSSALNAVTLNQSNPEFVYRVGNTYLEMQRFQEALPYLMSSYRNRPSDAPTINALAVCYLGLGRLDEAQAMIDKAIELRPEPGIVWLNAARISLRRGDFASTVNYLDEYNRRVPESQRQAEARMIRDSLSQIEHTR